MGAIFSFIGVTNIPKPEGLFYMVEGAFGIAFVALGGILWGLGFSADNARKERRYTKARKQSFRELFWVCVMFAVYAISVLISVMFGIMLGIAMAI